MLHLMKHNLKILTIFHIYIHMYSLSTLIEHIDSVVFTDDIWTSNLSKYRNVCSRHAAFVIANCFQKFLYSDIFEHVVLFSTSWIVIMSSYIQDISKNHFLVQHHILYQLKSHFFLVFRLMEELANCVDEDTKDINFFRHCVGIDL